MAMKTTVYKTLAYEDNAGVLKLDKLDDSEWECVLYWSEHDSRLEEYAKATSRAVRPKWAVSVEVQEEEDGTFTIT